MRGVRRHRSTKVGFEVDLDSTEKENCHIVNIIGGYMDALEESCAVLIARQVQTIKW